MTDEYECSYCGRKFEFKSKRDIHMHTCGFKSPDSFRDSETEGTPNANF